MAIDTIKKVSEGKPAPFPFTHTTTKTTSPHGTLIFEIIFSSEDDTNTGVIKKEDVDEDDDEDAGDGDVDDDDSSSSEESEEESDGDEDDDEEEDEDGGSDSASNEDEYEDEDEDEEDFGTGFDSEDDDLIIDFANEDDDLLVEFEDVSVDDTPPTPPPPAPKATPIPFWFTNEEQDQIRIIFDSYAATLNIEEQRRKCIRAPTPFIGRIIRTPLKPTDNDVPLPYATKNTPNNLNNKNNNNNNNNNHHLNNDDKVFKTLDKVEVYSRELYPLGTILPLSRVVWLLTEWDSLEGIPTRSVELAKSTQKSLQKRAMANQTSTLYCAPIFRTKDDYQFSVSSSSPSSPHHSHYHPHSHSRSPSQSSQSPSSPSLSRSSPQGSPRPFHSSSPPSSFMASSPPPLMYASSSSTNVSIARISPFLPEHCRVITFSMD